MAKPGVAGSLAGAWMVLAMALLSPASASAWTPDAGAEWTSYECIDAGMGYVIACASHADCPVGLSCSAELACTCSACAAEECDGDRCRCAPPFGDPGPDCRHQWVPRRCFAAGNVVEGHWEIVCPDSGVVLEDAGVDSGVVPMDAGSDAGTVETSPGCSAASHARGDGTGFLSIGLGAVMMAMLRVRRRRGRARDTHWM